MKRAVVVATAISLVALAASPAIVQEPVDTPVPVWGIALLQSKNASSPDASSQARNCVAQLDAQDACVGDSGGPLVVESVVIPEFVALIGVISCGRGSCGSDEFPGVYANVAKAEQFIRQYVRTSIGLQPSELVAGIAACSVTNRRWEYR